jgi:hypothetical protein
MSQQYPEPPAEQPDGDSMEMVRLLGLEDTDADRALPRPLRDWRLARSEIPVEQLSHRVTAFLESMGNVITGVPRAFGSYELDEITISAEVSAKGQVSLLGSGGEVAGKAGITFTFTKRPVEPPRH